MARTFGIRGATTVNGNSREEILAAVRELLTEIAQRNGIGQEDVASIIFTATNDLDAAFPAEAAREMGWNDAALIDAAEMAVPGSLPRVVRVLMHVNVCENGFKPRHIYLRGAANLRPDLISGKEGSDC